MRAFNVGITDNTPKVVRAEAWDVDPSDGMLTLHIADRPVAAFPQGVWCWVIEIPEVEA